MERAEIAPYVAKERYAWPGGYPLFAITDDGGILCNNCCRDEAGIIRNASESDGWYVVALDSMANCDTAEICDHCGNTVEGNPPSYAR